MQIKESPDVYDVIIVGSGAGGGMATKVLSESGLKVAVVEAGPYYDPAAPEQRTQLKWPWESPRRGASSVRPFGDFDSAYGGWEIEGQPYTNAPGTRFDWFRSQMLGGRTNHWGRISLRFGPNDFKHKSIDGLGEDWPIGYEDVKPYYDRVDKLIGVFGSKENIPNEPDGFFLPPPKPRLHELYFIKGAKKAGVTVIPNRLSILTKRINEERGVCFYCSQCNRACSVYADFSSGTCLIFPAQKAGGQIDLYVNSMVREVLTDNEGKATGVSYVNKEDRQEYALRGKVVVLAASACSSARILLNSKSAQHPAGLGNSSGVVGKYLHDSTGASRAAFIPDLMNRKTYNEDGVGGAHIYFPWWLDNKELDFPRGYHMEVWGGMGMPSYGFGFNPNDLNQYIGEKVGGYGNQLRDDVKKFYGSVVGLSGRGECIAREDNYCEIDPNVVDEFGIPVLRFNYTWSDHERNQARHMHDTFEEVFDGMGGVVLGSKPGKDQDYGLAAPGRIIHEVGTTRMGDDRRKSVVNRYQQLHDAKNVFIVDGGPFVSQADKNPTWTILALSWRTSDYIVEQIKQRNI
ncbi:GMC family oxidoreductase [Fulvivirga sedimenti]|uniref:GMC family oxidoreductase n=1 Tax=Fulvivirga sedimenti TaxID=2879465 RepID=A0A9X1HV62_9BACT|nr:GMC family oxidoreductase [Fulvivirga sedimenti]MCA6074749.1 GMC family oxidoreductase [Fulvivirga sedimenti]MCA6075926.1 GMC family oxidoreductase [Fulvivirga sedimenti]MCA6077054.1 GMC family oxidoreductase [Fulvivirga sedimenti]